MDKLTSDLSPPPSGEETMALVLLREDNILEAGPAPDTCCWNRQIRGEMEVGGTPPTAAPRQARGVCLRSGHPPFCCRRRREFFPSLGPPCRPAGHRHLPLLARQSPAASP